MSSIVFTLKRSSRARAIAYRTNSDFEGKPCSFDAAASSFACSFVSLRLIVCTRIVIRRYYLTLMTSFVNLKSPPRVGAYCDDLHRLSAQSRHSYFTGVVRGRIREGSVPARTPAMSVVRFPSQLTAGVSTMLLCRFRTSGQLLAGTISRCLPAPAGCCGPIRDLPPHPL